MEKDICYCLHAFRTAEILEGHISDCFKINGKHMIQILEKDEYVRFKNYV